MSIISRKEVLPLNELPAPDFSHLEDRVDLAALRCRVFESWTLGETHGIRHWDRVYANGRRLIVDGVNPLVVACFSYVHDACRKDDWEDFYHGPRAAEWIATLRKTYLKGLTDEEFMLLQDACRLHTTAWRTGNPTIDACFDADRLDLWRVGITPDPSKMATPLGAELASQARSGGRTS